MIKRLLSLCIILVSVCIGSGSGSGSGSELRCLGPFTLGETVNETKALGFKLTPQSDFDEYLIFTSTIKESGTDWRLVFRYGKLMTIQQNYSNVGMSEYKHITGHYMINIFDREMDLIENETTYYSMQWDIPYDLDTFQITYYVRSGSITVELKDYFP
jgi:hypothetical protein